MLQGNKEKQEETNDPEIPINGKTQCEETRQPQEGSIMLQKELIGEEVPMSITEERHSVVTPAFGFSASRAQYSEQVPQHTASAFGEINQNSSHLSLGTQRPFQSLLTPTLFMKTAEQVSASLPIRSAFHHVNIGGAKGGGNIGELNNCSTNAANSEMNA